MQYNGLNILFEDNHIIVVNKSVSDLVQKDNTGDLALDDKIKLYIKEKYNKPGNVYIGIPHRLDRPVSGLVIYAKTSKALSRLTVMFRDKKIQKTYWAIVKNNPPLKNQLLTHYLSRNTKQNKAYASNHPKEGAKESKLEYSHIAYINKLNLLEINLITGRHHQIRCQLSTIGCPIIGDKKYGYPTPNKDLGICLHARKIAFIHPVKKEPVEITAPLPDTSEWNTFRSI